MLVEHRRADNRVRRPYQDGMTITYADILLLIASPAIGSFLALLADRLPRGEDFVKKPSACRSCKRNLGLPDLVPIASFAWSRGTCRHCGARIPAWLLYMEITSVGLAVISVILGHGAIETWVTALFLWVLLTLIATDLLWFRLPDILTALLFVLVMFLSWQTGHPSVSEAVSGAVIGSGAFLVLQIGYKALRGREGLGTGDVKLMAGLGAALGPWNLPLMLLIASLAALASTVADSLVSRRPMTATRPLPFGASLAAATGFLWCLMRLPA